MRDERTIIVGSGPAAAGVALALAAAGRRDIQVLDVGTELEPDTRAVVASMAAKSSERWTSADLETVSRQPVALSKRELPQKRVYGSDFPFRDAGQLAGIDSHAGANSATVSSAYGGFSNVWGAQIMPFSRSTFDTWPISWEQIAPHYSAVLDEVPLAADHDDLLDPFPLLTERAKSLPPLAQRSQRVLDRYREHQREVRAQGVRIGRARLAMHATECVRCGLCMTGCPYGLIYSASQTFDRLRREGVVNYQAKTLATAVGEDSEGCFVAVRSLSDGRRDTLRADRLFVACGGIGSTRLVVGSLADPPDRLMMSESMQFALPFVSRRSASDPRTESTFTLNQFNLLVEFDESSYHTSQVHCYPYNPSVLTALPAPLRMPALSALTGQVLARLTIGLGYLPSWAAPPIRIAIGAKASDELPSLTIGDQVQGGPPLMLGEVMERLRRVARLLDLYPVERALRLSGPAKSYHFGGSLPHRSAPVAGELSTDRLGRVRGWDKVHVVDGAVLPSVPSTTFTLTVMANAHRIAAETAVL